MIFNVRVHFLELLLVPKSPQDFFFVLADPCERESPNEDSDHDMAGVNQGILKM